jgi:hypothetical protein
LVGVARKVTAVPGHIAVVGFLVIVTDGTTALEVIVSGADVAVGLLAQLALLVITTSMTSPATGIVV